MAADPADEIDGEIDRLEAAIKTYRHRRSWFVEPEADMVESIGDAADWLEHFESENAEAEGE